MTKRIALIDGDFILWKVCPNLVLTETEVMYGVNNVKTLEETLQGIDWYVTEKILKYVNVDSYIGFLGGKGNFRKLLTDSYKEGRTEDRPPFFQEAKQHLVDKWGFHIVDNIESEDAVGICLTKYPDSIIVHTDHDLNQLEGYHYNPVKDSWETISNEKAIYNRNIQYLSGCSTDRVRGLKKGVGQKTAEKLLDGYPTEGLIWEVINLYIKEYGEYKCIEEFYTQYKLLTILRDKEDFIIPEPTEVVRDSQIENLDEKLTF